MEYRILKDFENCKKKMAAITYRPQPNLKDLFILTTDASNKAIGATISQINSKKNRRIVHSFSKALDKAQENYSITDKEVPTAVKGINHFRYYL